VNSRGNGVRNNAMPRRIKDEYEIVAELGEGGMATVHKAIQKSLNRPVAIKELRKDYHADDVIVRRFEREARLAASFQHENIAHIYDFAHKPEFCIVMEYVDGISLARILQEMGPLPVDVGAMIALQVANALEYAHTRGIIHRDIKPGNIMVKRNGEVKVMDFGVSWIKNLDSLTLPGTLIGTPSYMSPEQALGNPLDARSDIFSLGIVLYEMFTGMKPFQDEKTASITAKIVKGKFPSPRSVNNDVPRSIQRIIRKCLKKKPHRRYGSMQELARALGKRIRGMDKSTSLMRISDYLVEENLVEAPEADETVVIYRAPGLGAFTKIVLTISCVLILLAGGIGYYSWTKARAARLRQPVPPIIQPAPAAISAPATTTAPASPAAAPALPPVVSPGAVNPRNNAR
jgi:serine/threonine protein kinase